ncbi:MAG: PTS sugar transporter subunit IIB [Elusimicrobia bacterium]|nr:PTS sugar transporter subunit IIB [Elusimicrobiota bacterium]
MEIALIRIDSRLIHGQVVQGWLPSLSVKEVVVVSDTAASSKLMGKMMRMSLPQEYALQVMNPSAAASHLLEEAGGKALVLVEDVSSLPQLLSAGLKFKEVIIGNTKYEESKKQYSQGVFLSAEEYSLLKKMSEESGVDFILKTLPTSLKTRLF